MKTLILIFLVTLPSFAQVNYNSSFIVTKNPKVGRIHDEKNKPFCTATLIGRSCAITAGHCANSEMVSVQFDIPVNNRYNEASSMDTYMVDQRSIKVALDYHARIDWAVFRLQKHEAKTGLHKLWNDVFIKHDLERYPVQGYYPGDIQGHYQVSFEPVKLGTPIVLYGHGKHENKIYDSAQKRKIGVISPAPDKNMRVSKYSMFHSIGTTPGDSGSAIIDATTDKIIGIQHTNFTNKKTGKNHGGEAEIFAQDRSLRRAIVECLEYEKNYL